jgi:hypothetical protein
MSAKKNLGGLLLAAAFSMSAQPADLNKKLLAYLPFTQNLEDASPSKLPVKTIGEVAVENGAAYFPGGKGALELPTLPFNQPFAISMWIKTDKDVMAGLIEQRDAKEHDHLFHIMLRKTFQPYLGFYMNDAISPLSIKSDEWTHLIFQYTGTHQEIWVNGRLLCSRRAKSYEGTKGATFIGKNPGWRNVPAKNFQGYMRELRIYGRSLSSEEVAKLNVSPAGIELANNSQASSNTNIKPIKNSPDATNINAPTQPFLSIEDSTIIINGSPGEIYELEATTNLSQWESLVTLTNLTGQVEFTDTDAANHSERFYRVEVK